MCLVLSIEEIEIRGDANVRGDEVVILLEGKPVRGNRFFESPCPHQQFGVGIVRIQIIRDQFDVGLEGGFRPLPYLQQIVERTPAVVLGAEKAGSSPVARSNEAIASVQSCCPKW